MDRSIFFALGASVIAFLVILELVRQRKLREGYSLLWLFTALVMFVLALWRDLLHGVSALVGIAYPPNLLFLMAALFILFILLYFSTVISKLVQENKETAQQMALLRHEVQQLKNQLENQIQPSQETALISIETEPEKV
jgi:hypothetical protein